MKKIYFLLPLVGLLILASACREKMSDKSRLAAREGMKDHQVKKVNEAELLNIGMARGKALKDLAQASLSASVEEGLHEKGLPEDFKKSHRRISPAVDSLAMVYEAEVRRVSLNARYSKEKPDSIEVLLLESYEYSRSLGEQLTENIQDINGGFLLYTAPIQISDPGCVACHESSESELHPKTLEQIQNPDLEYSAGSLGMSDLRAMWSVRLSKKNIIRDL